jgi:RHS repeat-associated protein
LGTPRLATDADKTVIWRWLSDAFGVGRAQEDPDADNEVTLINHRFAGQYFDAESGLHYNYFRYYDPSTGRYTSSDRIGLDDGPNTYAYVGNNPLTYFDPNGLNRRGVNTRSPLQSLTNVQANLLINQIRRIDPAFSGHAASPRGNFSPAGVRALQRSLNNAQSAGFCGAGAALPRPNGVPPNWVVRPSKVGGGKRFINPNNPHNAVRIMPGNPSSPYSNSQSPYVRWTQNGQSQNAQGQTVPHNTPAAHIPLSIWNGSNITP